MKKRFVLLTVALLIVCSFASWKFGYSTGGAAALRRERRQLQDYLRMYSVDGAKLWKKLREKLPAPPGTTIAGKQRFNSSNMSSDSIDRLLQCWFANSFWAERKIVLDISDLIPKEIRNTEEETDRLSRAIYQFYYKRLGWFPATGCQWGTSPPSPYGSMGVRQMKGTTFVEKGRYLYRISITLYVNHRAETLDLKNHKWRANSNCRFYSPDWPAYYEEQQKIAREKNQAEKRK